MGKSEFAKILESKILKSESHFDKNRREESEFKLEFETQIQSHHQKFSKPKEPKRVLSIDFDFLNSPHLNIFISNSIPNSPLKKKYIYTKSENIRSQTRPKEFVSETLNSKKRKNAPVEQKNKTEKTIYIDKVTSVEHFAWLYLRKLGVSSFHQDTLKASEAKKAFRDLALKLHPDTNKKVKNEEFMNLKSSYSVLEAALKGSQILT
jgi:hypothetical protein